MQTHLTGSQLANTDPPVWPLSPASIVRDWPRPCQCPFKQMEEISEEEEEWSGGRWKKQSSTQEGNCSATSISPWFEWWLLVIGLHCLVSPGAWRPPARSSVQEQQVGAFPQDRHANSWPSLAGHTYGAFPLHGTVRFGTARYGTVRLSSGRFAFPPQFSTAIEWAGLFTRRYNCAASTAVTSS